ncbi:MAG: ribosomal protein S18-alanine N-acetyltransferase [Desulforhopalus sp.]|nr:ribosomal protein S18-alanine N-acetyltransferase [Desulforhopalus sp.]
MITVRAMEPADLGAVLEIENGEPSPWSLAALRQELEVRSGLRLVAEDAALRIVGWCACRLMWPEVELLKIAVAKRVRRRGVGSGILNHLLENLRHEKYSNLFLEVRAKNVAAAGFYHDHGFQQVGRRRGYYSEPKDDALLLRKDLYPSGGKSIIPPL